jgi:chromosome segregation ATPase
MTIQHNGYDDTIFIFNSGKSISLTNQEIEDLNSENEELKQLEKDYKDLESYCEVIEKNNDELLDDIDNLEYIIHKYECLIDRLSEKYNIPEEELDKDK